MPTAMPKEIITLAVSPEVAEALRSTSERDREELEALITAWLQRRDFGRDTQELSELMDEVGTNAERRGLTPAVLAELLRDG